MRIQSADINCALINMAHSLEYNRYSIIQETYPQSANPSVADSY